MLKIFFILIFFLLTGEIKSDEEYFLTLRNDKVNLRQGPSFDYPVKIFYKKKNLPVLVQDQMENFRKIRDHENNTGWIHVSQLSKRKAAITIDDDVIVFNKPTIFSKPVVKLKRGRLLLISKTKNEWTKIKVARFTGWVKIKSLWGRL
tara:strand:- start:2237 stop:2680 length:444 start_codon:yes stop_codon:yes gene_type:complete